ncbi:MAG: hypothetical protein IH997_03895, partial [Proteobacteria bacterium]|nr:hypothetical protein [Pseudomonadota bacterium]
IKMETINYTGANAFSGASLFYMPSCLAEIGHVFVGGTLGAFNPSTAVTMFGGAPNAVRIGALISTLSADPTNFPWIGFSGGNNRVGKYLEATGTASRTIPLTNIGGGAGANYVVYEANAALQLASVAADADYTVTNNGGANVLNFTTALTASRTVEIMTDTRFLHNGYRIRIVSRGAVNGANTLVIKAATITKATISSDNYAVELTWRRNPTAHSGWVITRQGAA